MKIIKNTPITTDAGLFFDSAVEELLKFHNKDIGTYLPHRKIAVSVDGAHGGDYCALAPKELPHDAWWEISKISSLLLLDTDHRMLYDLVMNNYNKKLNGALPTVEPEKRKSPNPLKSIFNGISE